MVVETKPGLETEEYWENLIKKSVSRYFLLGMLNERPMHGYEIAKAIEGCCEGWCKPTDGMIYPTLKELEDGGYIDCASEVIGGRKRKVCQLTPRGEGAYKAAARVWSSVLPYINSSVKNALSDGSDGKAGCFCERDE
jgi:DNA-binding PadR family transcriptional regulator